VDAGNFQIHYLPKMTTSSPPGFTVPTDEFSSNPRCRFDFLDNFERCKAAFLSAFYVDRIRIILFELYSIMLCPFLLSIWLPDSVEHLFVVENSYEHPTLGHWCVYGCLDESKLCALYVPDLVTLRDGERESSHVFVKDRISLGEFEMKEMDATPPRADTPSVHLPKPRVAKAIISFALTYPPVSLLELQGSGSIDTLGSRMKGWCLKRTSWKLVCPKAAKLLADIEEFQDRVLKNSLAHSEGFVYYDSTPPCGDANDEHTLDDGRPLHEQLLACMAEEELHGMEQQARRERLIRRPALEHGSTERRAPLPGRVDQALVMR
ncbi:Autophagy- protein 9A, partial [Perkinsus olseni]